MHYITRHLLNTLQQSQAYTQPRSMISLNALADLHNWMEMIRACEALADDRSKDTFARLMALRILHFTVPVNVATSVFSLYPEKSWNKLVQLAEKLPGVKGDYILDRLETWILKGYEYQECKAQKGDIVIDAGAYTGNTVSYFEQCVGDTGKVYAFEPMQKTFTTLQENMGHIPHVHLVQAGVSDVDGHVHIAEQNTPGANLRTEGSVRVETRSIDSFLQEQGLDRLDFLKMDIEGSEMAALKGAKNTIQNLHPKMAICVYHKTNDIFQIYKRVLAYNSHYTFYLKHCSNTLWETVLFCMPSDKPFQNDFQSELYNDDVSIAHTLRDAYRYTVESIT